MRKLDGKKLIENLCLGLLFIVSSTVMFLDITNLKACAIVGIITLSFCVFSSFKK